MLSETIKRDIRKEKREANTECQKIGQKIWENLLIKKFLESNIDIELIKKCTGMTNDELDRIKKSNL